MNIENKGNRWKWFGHVKIRNNEDITKKMDEIRVEGSQGRDRLKKKWMDIIEEGMRECGVNKNMVKIGRHEGKECEQLTLPT